MRTLDIHWPGLPAQVGVLSTLRSGGVSTGVYSDAQGKGGLNLGTHVGDSPEAVLTNRALLRSLLPNEPAWLEQVHGTQVVSAQNASSQKMTPRADASTATTSGAVCAIMTADCMPVLLADARGVAVGAAHAGWRGLASGVLERSVQQLRASGADEILAWLGPGIGPECFEVGQEVVDAFTHLGPAAKQAFVAITNKPGKYLGNLPMLARLALACEGVHQVAGGERCTVSEPSEFYSFRRDRITGRMATMIWIK
jgi:YfiH family protein